jgi:hypothetical protein
VERHERRHNVLDVLYVVVTVAFFVLSLGYVLGCERLK